MQRSVVGNIYGYLVCLLAILIFIHSAAGFVNGIFGVASPATFQGHRFVMVTTRGWGGNGAGGWMHRQGQAPGPLFHFHMRGGGMPGSGVAQNPAPMTSASAMPGNMARNAWPSPRATMSARGRLQAARALVVDLVLLIIAALLFRWHWRWLQSA